MEKFVAPIKVGLLGGGQLARMLALKGHELGFEMHALSAKQNDPVAQVVKYHHLGNPGRREDLENFLKLVNFATFESEFLDATLLSSVVKKNSCALYPHPDLMGQLQDRLSQKKLLQTTGLPTLPFAEINLLSEAENYLRKNKEGLVLKQRRFGYDGYGTFHAKTSQQLESLFTRWVTTTPSLIAEPHCRFKRELAISFSRNQSGQIIEFPLVESKQVNSRCLWVKGPSRHRQLTALTKKIKKFLKQTDYVGTIAFELFDTGKNLIINEIAPRVHNSAHYSLDALSVDQFSAHLLAIVDLALTKPKSYAKGFAMINLLGKTELRPSWPSPRDVRLHWYGKEVNRPGRKMGHLNAVAANPEKALRLVQAAERKFTL